MIIERSELEAILDRSPDWLVVNLARSMAQTLELVDSIYPDRRLATKADLLMSLFRDGREAEGLSVSAGDSVSSLGPSA